MKLRIVLLFLLGGIFVIGASLITRTKPSLPPRTLPAIESAQDLAVAPTPVSALVQAQVGNDSLPATVKARLIDVALQRRQERDARELLRKMIESGSVADVLAAIPKVPYFTEDTRRDIAAMQKSLCRFQTSSEDEFGFEMIKVKFDLVLGRDANVKPWTTVCGAG